MNRFTMQQSDHNEKHIPSILSQHAEETAFLWILRDDAVVEPHYNLPDLAYLDDRIEAHLDGLRIAGDPGWEISRKAMAFEEPGEIFTAGVSAFESGDPERMDDMLSAVEKDPELQRALVSALGWIEFDTIAEPARKLMSADLPFLRYLGVAAFAVHRQDPGAVLKDLLGDPDATVQARAVKAAGELGRVDLLPMVMSGYTSKDDSIRFYAARSGALMGHTPATAILQVIVQQPGPYAGQAVTLAANCLAPPRAYTWLKELAQNSEYLRLAAQGFGALGDPGAVDRLINLMHRPEPARVAGEAVSLITGVDIAYEDLDTDAPEGFQAGPNEDPEDDDVAPDPDEDLPWPDPERMAAWWHDRKKQFQHGTRYLTGQQVSDAAHLHSVLKNGFQRQRSTAAMALAMTKPDEPLFEYRAPGKRQQRRLG